MRKRLVAIVAVSVVADASAHQTALGSRLTSPATVSSRYSAEESIRGGHQFAECLVHRREPTAVRLLEATTAAEADAASGLLSRESRCISLGEGKTEYESETRMSAPTALFRGLIAEELIHQNYASVVVPALPMQRVYHAAASGYDGRDSVTDDMAVCVAVIDPAGTRTLLDTPPASAAEGDAMWALSPRLGQCLIANAQLKGNRQSIRAALAEALYHRITTPAVSGEAKPQANGQYAYSGS